MYMANNNEKYKIQRFESETISDKVFVLGVLYSYLTNQ